jgi:hypothetical protein
MFDDVCHKGNMKNRKQNAPCPTDTSQFYQRLHVNQSIFPKPSPLHFETKYNLYIPEAPDTLEVCLAYVSHPPRL